MTPWEMAVYGFVVLGVVATVLVLLLCFLAWMGGIILRSWEEPMTDFDEHSR